MNVLIAFLDVINVGVGFLGIKARDTPNKIRAAARFFAIFDHNFGRVFTRALNIFVFDQTLVYSIGLAQAVFLF